MISKEKAAGGGDQKAAIRFTSSVNSNGKFRGGKQLLSYGWRLQQVLSHPAPWPASFLKTVIVWFPTHMPIPLVVADWLVRLFRLEAA